jgi:hypothetical protein
VGEGVRNQERHKESEGKRRGKEESEGGERAEAEKRGRGFRVMQLTCDKLYLR